MFLVLVLVAHKVGQLVVCVGVHQQADRAEGHVVDRLKDARAVWSEPHRVCRSGVEVGNQEGIDRDEETAPALVPGSRVLDRAGAPDGEDVVRRCGRLRLQASREPRQAVKTPR